MFSVRFGAGHFYKCTCTKAILIRSLGIKNTDNRHYTPKYKEDTGCDKLTWQSSLKRSINDEYSLAHTDKCLSFIIISETLQTTS